MYKLAGNEFGDLVTREFTVSPVSAEISGSLKDVFSCRSKNIRTDDFDILNFAASFQQDIRVSNFQDTTHVSMHFQLTGRSDASISGLATGQPMRSGQFNILNCVDPVSSFDFPKQTHYEYTCIGLKPPFFNAVLEECGTAYDSLLQKSRKREGFTLFNSGVAINHFQITALKLLQNPPIADNLKISYIRSKVKELILLSLESHNTGNYYHKETISNTDLKKLHAVKEHITQFYLKKFTLEGISKAFLLNEFKLKNGFKATFGSTVFEFIHSLRMKHAFDLLKSGGLTVGEVAAITGYSSDSSFIRAFKSFHGCTPGLVH